MAPFTTLIQTHTAISNDPWIVSQQKRLVLYCHKTKQWRRKVIKLIIALYMDTGARLWQRSAYKVAKAIFLNEHYLLEVFS